MATAVQQHQRQPCQTPFLALQQQYEYSLCCTKFVQYEYVHGVSVLLIMWYFPYCTKIITHHLLSDECKKLPRIYLLLELDRILIVLPTFCPRLIFAGCARVDTNDVHGSGPLVIHVVRYVYNILCQHFVWNFRVLQHARATSYFGEKRSCALQQQYAYSLCCTRVVLYETRAIRLKNLHVQIV